MVTPPSGSNLPNLTRLFTGPSARSNDGVFLSLWTPESGNELAYFSAASGFVTLPEPVPGSASSVPASFQASAMRVGSEVLFAATTPATGLELFTTLWTETGAGVAEPWGDGCAGASGTTPDLSIDAPPTIATPFTPQVTSAPPGAPVILARSTGFEFAPLGPCTLYLPAPTLLGVANADGSSSASFAYDLSGSRALAGLALWTQALVIDPGAGWLDLGGLTPALELVVGP